MAALLGTVTVLILLCCHFLILFSSSFNDNVDHGEQSCKNLQQIHSLFGGQVIAAGYQVQVNKLCR